MEMGKGKGRIRADCCQAGCWTLLWLLAKRRGVMWRWHERLPGPAPETAWGGGGREALWRFSSSFPPLHHLTTLLSSLVVLFLWYHMLFCRDLVLLFVVLVVLQKPRIWSGRVLSVFWTSHWIPGDSRQFLCIKSTCIRGHMSMLWV